MKQEIGPALLKRKPRYGRVAVLICLLLLMVIGTLFGFSYIFPGSVRHLDIVRLPVQSRIMSAFSHYTLDDLFPNTETYDSAKYLQIDNLRDHFQFFAPGDIFFTYSDRYLSNSFIPGKWKHSVIYLGTKEQINESKILRGAAKRSILRLYKNGDEILILDSSEKGVSIRDITALSNLTYNSLLLGLCAFRINKQPEQIAKFVKYAFEQLGKPYDWDLITGNTDQLYCSELIYEGLKKIDITIDMVERIVGRDVISPNAAVNYILDKGIHRGEFVQLLWLEPGEV